MKVVFLDRKSLGADLDLERFSSFGEVEMYDFSTTEEAAQRTQDADVIITNKVPMNASTLGNASHLKLICVTATGINNLDLPYLEERGIAWRNVAGYSTETVAQHTFALALYLLEHLNYYDCYVKEGRYVNDRIFTHFDRGFHELSSITWGIVGLGTIGKRVAELATCFHSNVVYYSTSGKNHDDRYREVDWETLLDSCDIISIHAPLTPETNNLFQREAFQKMKNSAILINVGRGPIVNEADLAWALEEGEIAGAGLDVLAVEPMAEDNPLRRITDSNRLIITPHIAWASIEARTRLMDIVYHQIEDFLK